MSQLTVIRNDQKENIDSALEEYLSLTSQIKALETRLNEIKPVIVSQVEIYGGKYSYNHYNFSIQQRKSFEYSFDVIHKENELKMLKLKEEMDGIAKLKSISSYPVVRASKVRGPSAVNSVVGPVSSGVDLPF